MTATRKWLLVFNCANIGLANCLKMLAPDLQVEATDFGAFRRGADRYRGRLDEFDLVITAPQFVNDECIDFRQAPASSPPCSPCSHCSAAAANGSISAWSTATCRPPTPA